MNCASDAPIVLRDYLWRTHLLILFDEISPSQVAAQRKLFQAGFAPIQLGASVTGNFLYTVFVHSVRMVCCSNDWSALLRKLPESVQGWLAANSVHVIVDAPLWRSTTEDDD